MRCACGAGSVDGGGRGQPCVLQRHPHPQVPCHGCQLPGWSHEFHCAPTRQHRPGPPPCLVCRRRNVLPPGLSNLAFIGQNATFQHVLTTALQVGAAAAAAGCFYCLVGHHAKRLLWELRLQRPCARLPPSLPPAVPLAGRCAQGQDPGAARSRAAEGRGGAGGKQARPQRWPACCLPRAMSRAVPPAG